MFRFILVACLIASLLALQVLAQAPTVDVVHLKNGSIIRGTIIEQIPSKSLKIQTPDGNLFVYTMEEITKITKEPVAMSGWDIDAKKDASTSGVEVGTMFGLSYVPDSWTRIGLPAGSTDNLPSLYLKHFINENVAVGPEVKFYRRSSDGFSGTSLTVGLQSTFFMQGHSMSNPYILGYGFLDLLDTSDSDVQVYYAIGAGMGYQWRIGPAFVFRAEGRYQRWISSEEQELANVHEFLLVLALGTRFDGI